MSFQKPTPDEVQAAYGKVVPDIIAEGLSVLFCGINASIYSAAVGHHFARPGNRFWKTLHGAGFSDRLLHPSEDHLLLSYGCGLTNLVDRATARADEVSPEEFRAGRHQLAAKIQRYRPHCLAVLGISAYRVAFERKKAKIGPQSDSFQGAKVWVLPNPSGLNAHYQLPDLQRLYREARLDVMGKRHNVRKHH